MLELQEMGSYAKRAAAYLPVFFAPPAAVACEADFPAFDQLFLCALDLLGMDFAANALVCR